MRGLFFPHSPGASRQTFTPPPRPPAPHSLLPPLEAALGVPVIRHATKKPGGSADALASHFRIPPAAVPSLVMVGDRYLTDVVYGNRLGLLTVRPAPVTAAGEPRAVRLVSFFGWERR